GSADVAGRLWVFRKAGSGACAATPALEDGVAIEMSGAGWSSPAGDARSEERRVGRETFTPGASGSYRICAYIDGRASAAAAASTSELLTVRELRASIGPVVMSGLRDGGVAVWVSVLGSTEVEGRLWVFRKAGSGACAATPALEDGVAIEMSGAGWSSPAGDA